MSYPFARSDFEDVRRIVVPGTTKFRKSEQEALANLFPNRPVDKVEWMFDNIHLTPDVSPTRPGPMRLDKLQAGIARADQELGARIIVWQKPPRAGSTIMVAGITLYYSCHEASDTFFCERNDSKAQAFHDKYIYKMLTGSPKLAHLKRPDSRSGLQDKWTDTILVTGATMQMRSASTNGAFRQVRGRYLACDEVSDPAWAASASDDGYTEGSKVDLVWGRGREFFDPILYAGSSPTDEEHCIISKMYLRSDQRKFFVPCPHCEEMQELRPSVGKEGPGLHFSADEETGDLLTYVNDAGDAVPDVWYECEACGSLIRETYKEQMIEGGEWRATAKAKEPGLIGFYSWAIHSSHPQSTWTDIVHAYRKSLFDPEARQTFKNQWLAQRWEREETRSVPVHYLQERAQAYDAPCPTGVQIVLGGCDNQQGREDGGKDGTQVARSEIVFQGYGAGEESWVVSHKIIALEPFTPPWAEEVWKLLDTPLRRPDGTDIWPAGLAVDVGWNMDRALEFVHNPESKRRGIVGVRGRSEVRGARNPIIGRKPSKKGIYEFHLLGTQSAKDTIFRRLRQEQSGADCIHFPRSLPEAFYRSLTASRIKKDSKTGKTYWDDLDGNEVLDCCVYALALLRIKKATDRVVRERINNQTHSQSPPSVYDGPDRSADSESLARERMALGESVPAPKPPEPGTRRQKWMPPRTPLSPAELAMVKANARVGPQRVDTSVFGPHAGGRGQQQSATGPRLTKAKGIW